jgi:hypothetical protein
MASTDHQKKNAEDCNIYMEVGCEMQDQEGYHLQETEIYVSKILLGEEALSWLQVVHDHT